MIILPLAWLEIAEYAYYIIVAALAVSSVIQAQKAKKAAQQALDKAKGLLYQFRATTSPRRVLYGRRRIGGLEAYVTSAGAKNENLFYVLIWADGPNEAVEKLLFDGIEVPLDSSGHASGKWSNLVSVESRLGGSDNFTAITDMGVPLWSSSDMLLGINYSIIKLTYDDKVFPNGVPNISAVIRGRNDIFDERYSAESYSTNPVLCLNHYLTTSRTGPGIDYATRVAIDEFVEAANACDEHVTLSLGGYQLRYSYNDVVTLDTDPELIIEGFKTAFSGVVVYTGGKWHYYAGVYVTPTFTITKSMLVGAVLLQTKISKINHINTVKGTYVAECNDWQPTSFPPVTNATYLTEDGGELLENIDYTSKNTVMESRRMAKIELMRQRLSRSLQIQMNIAGMRAQPGLPVIFDFPELQFFNQSMMVLEYGMSIQNNIITIGLSLREYGSGIFAWNSSEDDEANDCTGPTVATIGSPPGFPDAPGGPGLRYGDLLPNVYPIDAGFASGCKVQGGTAGLVGYASFSFGGADSPPKKWRKKKFEGFLQADISCGGLGCVGCNYAYDIINYSGDNNYSREGALTQSSNATWKHNGSGCSGGTVMYNSIIENLNDVSYGSEDVQICPIITSKTRTRAFLGDLGCTPGSEGTCRLIHSACDGMYLMPSGGATETLSVEDTEEDAIYRLENTFVDWSTIMEVPITDDSCSTDWGVHSSGYTFPYTQARLTVRLIGSGGYFVGWPYEVEFDLIQRDSGTSDPFVKVGTLSVTITADSAGGGSQEVDIPTQRGKETRVSGGKLL